MNAISANDAAMSDAFNFTEVRMCTPLDNLTAAVGMIQSHILASDTHLDAQVMFGRNDLHRRAALEAAVAMLVPLFESVCELKWSRDSNTPVRVADRGAQI